MIEIINVICAILQTIFIGFMAYSGWVIAYNKVLPFHRLKWQSEFIKERKKQGML